MEEGRNLENYTVQGLLDELGTYEHELKKKKEEQVTPFPTALMTTPRVPSSEGTCPRNCDTPSSSQPSSSKMENYDEEFAMMVKQFRKFKKFLKKADSVRRPSKGKPQVSDSPPESYLCYNCRKPSHWKSACPYPKVEKYGERERIEKKKKAMVAAESDESSSSSSDEEALVCMERRAEKSNHEDRWTIIPTSENLFDQFKKMMKDFEEINLKHSSLTEENKLLSEENLKLTEAPSVQFTVEEEEKLPGNFSRAVIGWCSSKTYMPDVEDFLIKGGFKEFKLRRLKNQEILFIFKREEDYLRWFHRRSWKIKSSTITLCKWTPNHSHNLDYPVIPLWVEVRNIPLHLSDHKPLFSIASALGKPIKLGAKTAMGFYPGTAKVCVEMDVSLAKPPKIHVRLGSKDVRLPCTYEDHPPYCSQCKRFGHLLSHCRRKGSVVVVGHQGVGNFIPQIQEWKMVTRKRPKPSLAVSPKSPPCSKPLSQQPIINSHQQLYSKNPGTPRTSTSSLAACPQFFPKPCMPLLPPIVEDTSDDESPLHKPTLYRALPPSPLQTLTPPLPPPPFPPDLSFLYPGINNSCQEIIPFIHPLSPQPIPGSKDDSFLPITSDPSWEPEDFDNEDPKSISPLGYHSEGDQPTPQQTPISPMEMDLSLCSKVSMPLQKSGFEKASHGLTGYATRSKTRKAVWELDGNSASGPDGFNGNFFKATWETIRQDVLTASQEFFMGQPIPRAYGSTFLTLIPKTDNPKRFEDYRPISLSTFMSKINTKLLANRLNKILPKLISKEQVAFQKGKSIEDHILMAQEAVHLLDKKVFGGNFILKLDMAKAFDKLDWGYLEALLKAFGFSNLSTTLLMANLRGSYFSILLNGEPAGYFKMERGVKQGDPLSPLLFILAAEGFSRLINQHMDSSHLLRFNSGQVKFPSHLIYADDIMIFSRGDSRNLLKLKSTLDTYLKASGQEINLNKSKFYTSNNTTTSQIQHMEKAIGISRGKLPFTHLGAPICHGILRKEHCKDILGHFEKRIHFWYSKTLNQMGRLILIKHVLSSIPLHILAVHTLPKYIIHTLTKYMANFL
ncbi:unnamed protein product [Cuscuta campestris]|uniref:Reverse transcriptase domain-containing protein n=1 Tax=Cuscuta campestris TaxID=132261 RepID=A0A484M7Q5_9ASTE|nr:unnamed protein product [Cuscuta campestris]